MMYGSPLSALLPEDSGLGDRFWYWCGTSGQRYIHSIYRHDLCPAVPGAVFVLVSTRNGLRQAVAVGRFDEHGEVPRGFSAAGAEAEAEIHVHLLARDEEGAERVLRDLKAAMTVPAPPPMPEPRPHVKPVQLELLAA